MRKLYIIQSVVLCIVGIGALFGGILAIFNPYELPVEMLKRGPFTSFLIPGLFLFFIIGVGHLSGFILIRLKWKYHAYFVGALGCILMAWIVIQCYVLQDIHYLHVIFFIVGLGESIIALIQLIKLKLFPFSKKFYVQ